ncbi:MULTISPECIES: hypothetical protein [unclassified Streptomyces]|uniref:hypothetical protein n=1 Tax=unclassified Streptomyces TaxID=2593676 RepID=UPI00131B5978|nr:MULTISPECIES: hypothetical protein [unclassified Streptomyces]
MMKKRYVALLAAAAIAPLGLHALAAAPPTGRPTGCTDHQSSPGGGWLATCGDSNGGHYKAAVICTRSDGAGDVTVHSVDWKDKGEPSYIACPPFTSVKSGGIITRSH